MAKLLNNTETKAFIEAQELKGFISQMESKYEWRSIPTSDTEYIGLDDNPICIPILRDEFHVPEDVSNDTIQETMERGSKMILKIGKSAFPVGDTAYRGIFQRIGAECPALTSLKDVRDREEVVPSDKATVCNILKKYAKGDSVLLVGDEQVLADLSEKYVYLPVSELLEKTEEVIRGYEGGKLYAATVSHELVVADYIWYDSDIQDNLIDAFSEAGIDVTEMDTHILISTSNVGLSGANVYPFLKDARGTRSMLIGSPIKLKHEGDASPEKFKENVEQLFASFKDLSDKIRGLKDITINHPAGCLYGIGQKLQISEKLLREEVEKFKAKYPTRCTGADIYTRLFEIMDIVCADEESSSSALKVLQMNETICRIIFSNSLKGYDMAAIIR